MDNALTNNCSRPKQAERSDAMRSRLLEATLDIISEQGWARTSTQKICVRAGVSRGAQTHHFLTKESLLIAAVQENVARYQCLMNEALAKDDAMKPDLRALFDFLWDACFEGNLLNCWMEAMVAARTDMALQHAVRDMDTRSIHAMRVLGDACVGNQDTAVRLAADSSEADIVELTIYLLRGMVVQNAVHPDHKHRTKLFEIWKKLVLTT